MTRIEKSIIINQPVEAVFKYASDWEKWSDWFEGVSDFRPTTEIKNGNGARYAYKAKMMGLNIAVETEIRNFVENQGWTGIGTKGVPTKARWIFEKSDQGTMFTYVLEYKLPFPQLSSLFDKYIMKPQWNRILEKSLQNLKHKLL